VVAELHIGSVYFVQVVVIVLVVLCARNVGVGSPVFDILLLDLSSAGDLRLVVFNWTIIGVVVNWRRIEQRARVRLLGFLTD
jgi:uncharacterized membrane protein YczE